MFSLIYVIISVSLFNFSNGQEKLESICNINGEKALQRISEKFLSISIDPAVLLAGLNLSDTSLALAEHMSPAYIRIAGPSTKFVHYVDSEGKSADSLSEDGSSVVVTPSMWFGINEWLRLANLTPVFGINDAETASGGVWNPKSTLPLLEISDKLNVRCYWQLGFDPSKKNELQYKQDLNILYHVLQAFPGQNNTWKIVGSDISRVTKEPGNDMIEELKGIITAVMWEPERITQESFPEKDTGWHTLNQENKPAVGMWTTVPKSAEPISFSSALLWARQVGDAAKLGYEVIFRQPRLHEMFSDTPAYWFSLLHKKLMGNNVLETKTNIHYPGSAVYAHCTRKQNGDARHGALTIMIVNNNLQKYKAKVRLGTVPAEKSTEVLSYILTSCAQNSTDIFLNGKRLTVDLLSNKDPFTPKHIKTLPKSYVSLELPPLSIGFFVLPDAKLPVCDAEESRTNVMPEEDLETQIPIASEELTFNFASRSSFIRNPTLKEITQKMKKELQSDERFYKDGSLKTLGESEVDNVKKPLIDKTKTYKPRMHLDLEKRREDLKKFLSERTKAIETRKSEPKMQSKSKTLDLTSEEVEKILKERAKARAAERNIIFTDEELDALLSKASKQFLQTKFKESVKENLREKRNISSELLKRQINHDSTRLHRKPRDINSRLINIRSKIEENKQRMEDKRYEILGNAQTAKENIIDRIRDRKYKNKRFKRDINMDLLKIKAEGQNKDKENKEHRRFFKKLFKDKEAKAATIRNPEQTSAEIFEELEEEQEQLMDEKIIIPKKELFAELAEQEEDEEEANVNFLNPKTRQKVSGIFDKRPKVDPFSNLVPTPKSTRQHDKKSGAKLEENIKFLTTSEEFTDVEDDFPCIHEYFGSVVKSSKGTNSKKTKQELGETEPFKKIRRKENDERRKSEFSEITLSSETDPFKILRKKRDVDVDGANKSNITEMQQQPARNIPEDSSKNSYDSKLLVFDYSSEETLGKHTDSKLDKEEKTCPNLKTPTGFDYEQMHLKVQGLSEENVKNQVSQNNLSDLGLEVLYDEHQNFDLTSHQNSTNIKDENNEKTENLQNIANTVNRGLDENMSSVNKSESIDKMVRPSGDIQMESYSLRPRRYARDEVSALVRAVHELEDQMQMHKRNQQLGEKRIKESTTLKLKTDEPKTNVKLEQFNSQKERQIWGDHFLGELYKVEKEATRELLEKLEVLNKLLSERKKEIDTCLATDKKLGHQVEENNAKETEAVTKTSKHFEMSRVGNKNGKTHNTETAMKKENMKEEDNKRPTAYSVYPKDSEEDIETVSYNYHEKRIPSALKERYVTHSTPFTGNAISSFIEPISEARNNLETEKIQTNLYENLPPASGLVGKQIFNVKDIEGRSNFLKERSQAEENIPKHDMEHMLHGHVYGLPSPHIMKRSLFDKYTDGYGSYKPLTTNLKSWRPSDIMSLKQDVKLKSLPNLRPTKNFPIHNNAFQKDWSPSYISKRSVSGNDLHEDETINFIDKDSFYGHSKLKTTKVETSRQESLPNIETNLMEDNGGHGRTESEDRLTDAIDDKEYKETAAPVWDGKIVRGDPMISYTFEADSGTEPQNMVDSKTERIQSTAAFKQDLPLSIPGQRMFMNFVENVSGFFREVGKKLQNYLKHIV